MVFMKHAGVRTVNKHRKYAKNALLTLKKNAKRSLLVFMLFR